MSNEIIVSSKAAGDIPDEALATLDSANVTDECDALPAVSITNAAPTVGQLLRAARETKGMTTVDVALALKLSARQVSAIEAGDWSILPGNTIIRGFIRNYARLLNIAPDPLMNALDALQLPKPPSLDFPESINSTMPQTGKAERRDYAAVFAALIILGIAFIVYFFIPLAFWQSTMSVLTTGGKSSEAVSETAGSVAKAVTQPVSEPDRTVLTPPSDAAVAQNTVPAQSIGAPATTTPVTAVPIAGGSSNQGLKLSFSQPSWVEIRDRSGEIIFSQLNPAGSQRDIEGQPPFSLVIGSASNVTVQYKGQVVELVQRSKDDVARLTLD